MHAAARGALAGTVATVPMSVVMLGAKRLGLVAEQPPESLVRFAARATGQHPPRQTIEAAAAVGHLAVGAAVGSAYAMLPRWGTPLVRGVATGLATFAASYEGWAPSVGAMPAAHDDPSARPWAMTAAHVVFGVTLALVEDRLRRSRG